LTTSAESAALTGVGAEACAVGSQKWAGTSAVLSTSAATINARPVAAVVSGTRRSLRVAMSTAPADAYSKATPRR
jgi:hypothetical protein